LGVIVFLNGIEMIVWGLRPTDVRQMTLLKLILFSAFYGLVLINWVDLYGTSAPAYHIWLVMTYMAPFGVLIVFQGFKDWQLALSLGLLVSLMNDVGYFFVGDLLFGFHRALLPWIEGQLGFQGSTVLFTFQGGLFNIPVNLGAHGLHDLWKDCGRGGHPVPLVASAVKDHLGCVRAYSFRNLLMEKPKFSTISQKPRRRKSSEYES